MPEDNSCFWYSLFVNINVQIDSWDSSYENKQSKMNEKLLLIIIYFK